MRALLCVNTDRFTRDYDLTLGQLSSIYIPFLHVYQILVQNI
jgi:hypothetical protein